MESSIPITPLLQVLLHQFNYLIDMANFNLLFGQQTMKMFPDGHKMNLEAQKIFKAHQEGNVHYGEFLKSQKALYAQFKQFFDKFKVVGEKIKLRDKSLNQFKHYYEKLNDMNRKKTSGNVHSSGLLGGLKKEKGEDVLARVLIIHSCSPLFNRMRRSIHQVKRSLKL